MLTTTTDEVKPAGARLEGWALAAATFAVVAVLALYVRLNGSEGEVAKLYDWQVSAFDGLAGADQAIYNSLYTVKDEIPLIYDDINAFNEPGVKFRWPNLQDFEDFLLPPFYQDTSWEQNGSLTWTLHEPLAEGEMQGSTMYLGTDGMLPEPRLVLADHRPRARRFHEQQLDRDLVERAEPCRDAGKRISRQVDFAGLARGRGL